jgi:anti-anti-sigma regulatory factor
MLQTMPGQNQNMSLDGSGVERVSTACLQVLVAACRAVRARGKMFRIDAPSPLLRAALTDLGLADAALGEVAA